MESKIYVICCTIYADLVEVYQTQSCFVCSMMLSNTRLYVNRLNKKKFLYFDIVSDIDYIEDYEK